MLKGNFKLLDKKRAVPDRLVRFEEGWNLTLSFESGEELETFRSSDFRSVEAEEDDDDDEDGNEEQEVRKKECIVDDGNTNVRLDAKVCRRKDAEISKASHSSSSDDEGKREQLEHELSREVINLEALQRLASSGLPDGGGLRAMSWKLLLGYLPAAQDSWERELAENRSKYAALKEELLLNPSELTRRKDEAVVSKQHDRDGDVDGQLMRHEISHEEHPLSLVKASVWHQYFQDSEIAQQIDRDLQRTHPDMRFFSADSSFGQKHRKAMRNILLLFAKLNPAIRYVQGMNEVLAPLYYVFSTDPDEQNASNAEADSFACFVRLLSDSVDHFCEQLDNSSVGILSTLARLAELLKANDEVLWWHLEISNKVKPQFYAFRWITLLLTQEFNLHAIMRIWDSLLSNPFGVQEMLLRVCCAMLLCVRSELLKGDFAANLKLLQHYPHINIEYLLQVAQELSPQSNSIHLSL
ncbi:uncharacterized protein LOC131223159 isoform X1 [Magnolia sinica]|uniref:uncharacterized protein LOC131223159 isoform X1 n=1 Tax=Magnolia sinica TaxID=86752 RepID=UPI00265AA363|nr:uncharacterized protein LOC131223159 isoform X1 [Magnolia sinica]